MPNATDIGPKKLNDLLKSCRGLQSDMDESRGQMGNLIGQAVEKEGLHRKAFSLVRKLDHMEPDKLADFMDAFEDYFVKAGLQTRRESAPRLPMEPTENEADEAEQQAAGSRKRGRPRKNGGEETDGAATTH